MMAETELWPNELLAFKGDTGTKGTPAGINKERREGTGCEELMPTGFPGEEVAEEPE